MVNQSRQRRRRGGSREIVARCSITLPVVVALGVSWLARSSGGVSESDAGSATVASAFPLATGFSTQHQHRTLTREPREAQVKKLRIRRSEPESVPGDEGNLQGLSEVTVAKSSVRYEGVSFTKGHREWNYLSKGVRQLIDSAGVTLDRWEQIVVHSSSTVLGDADALGYYHRTVKGLPDGLAYHFVIGNGSYSGDGEVEVGTRWLDQLDGAAAAVSGEIEICLVGDFDAHPVSRPQLDALDELIDYVRAKVGDVGITTHARSEGGAAASCPGRYFPADLVTARGDS